MQQVLDLMKKVEELENSRWLLVTEFSAEKEKLTVEYEQRESELIEMVREKDLLLEIARKEMEIKDEERKEVAPVPVRYFYNVNV